MRLHAKLRSLQLGWTALIQAAGQGHGDVVVVLLDHGADMEAKNDVSRACRPPRHARASRKRLMGSL